MPRQDTSEHALPEGCAQGPEQVPIARWQEHWTKNRGGQGTDDSGAHEAWATVQGSCREGQGDQFRIAAALREFRPLAERGNVMAQISLGYMYDKGLGVAQDYTEAAKWYRMHSPTRSPALPGHL